MPYREPDPSDPNVLVGVGLPGDRATVREMAYAFAEEFAALGFDERRLLQLFRLPGYVAAHRAYRELGEAEIGRIVREALGLWGRFRIAVQEPEATPTAGPRELVRLGRGEGGRPSRPAGQEQETK